MEDTLHKKPEELILDEKKVVPVFIEPLSAPLSCEEGDRVHFTARYEPIDDNQLQVRSFSILFSCWKCSDCLIDWFKNHKIMIKKIYKCIAELYNSRFEIYFKDFRFYGS